MVLRDWGQGVSLPGLASVPPLPLARGSHMAAGVQMFISSQLPCQTRLTATPRVCPCCCRTHRECSSACRSCHWVSLSGRRQEAELVRTLLVRLCPLIRCFRQGGVRCGYSLPAHGRGVWQVQSSPALPPLPGGFAGSSYVGPACLHLEDTGQNRFRPGGLTCPHPEQVPSLPD